MHALKLHTVCFSRCSLVASRRLRVLVQWLCQTTTYSGVENLVDPSVKFSRHAVLAFTRENCATPILAPRHSEQASEETRNEGSRTETPSLSVALGTS
jgi:hypothetical protein